MSKWRPSKQLLKKLNGIRELPAEEINHDDFTGQSALHVAVNAASLREVDGAIRGGAALDAVDDNELTPLLCACSIGGLKGMKIALRLIEAGADVNYVRQDDEMTALCFAASDSRPEVVQALLNAGAEVEGPGGVAQTPLMHAARANNVEAIKLLLAAGADPQRRCKLPWAVGRTAEWLAEQEGARKAAKYLRSLREGGYSRNETMQ